MRKILLSFLFLFPLVVFGQEDSITLLKPTGQFPVGTVIYEWADKSRMIEIAPSINEQRRIIVQIWYPAHGSEQNTNAPYAALSKDYQKVVSHSLQRVPFNKSISSSNLILISPGRGTERYLYTSLAEELASHGFTVASVDMPEVGYTIYQDGFIIKPSSEFQPPRGMMGGPYEKVDAFFEKPTQLGFEDISFAFKQLKKLNKSDPDGRFTGKINTKEIGIFGHSLGGRIAGKFAYENKNVKAYISMEGIPPRDIRYEGKLKVTCAMLCSSGTWPYAKENYMSLIDNRSNPVYMLELQDFGHNSLTDNPSIYPNSFKYKITPEKGIKISREIVLHYFLQQLTQTSDFKQKASKLEKVKFTEYK